MSDLLHSVDPYRMLRGGKHSSPLNSSGEDNETDDLFGVVRAGSRIKKSSSTGRRALSLKCRDSYLDQEGASKEEVQAAYAYSCLPQRLNEFSRQGPLFSLIADFCDLPTGDHQNRSSSPSSPFPLSGPRSGRAPSVNHRRRRTDDADKIFPCDKRGTSSVSAGLFSNESKKRAKDEDEELLKSSSSPLVAITEGSILEIKTFPLRVTSSVDISRGNGALATICRYPHLQAGRRKKRDGFVVSRGLGSTVFSRYGEGSIFPSRELEEVHAGDVTAMAVARHSHYTAMGSSDLSISVWCGGGGGGLESPKISRSTAGGSGSLTLIPTTPSSPRQEDEENVLVIDNAHADWVFFLYFFSDEKGALLLLSGGDDGALKMWDPLVGTLISRSRNQSGHSIRASAFHEKSRLLCVGDDSEIGFYTVHDRKFTYQKAADLLGDNQGSATAAAFSADGKLLVVAFEDETFRLIDVDEGYQLASCTAHITKRMCVSLMVNIGVVSVIESPPYSSVYVILTAASDGQVILSTYDPRRTGPPQVAAPHASGLAPNHKRTTSWFSSSAWTNGSSAGGGMTPSPHSHVSLTSAEDLEVLAAHNSSTPTRSGSPPLRSFTPPPPPQPATSTSFSSGMTTSPPAAATVESAPRDPFSPTTPIKSNFGHGGMMIPSSHSILGRVVSRGYRALKATVETAKEAVVKTAATTASSATKTLSSSIGVGSGEGAGGRSRSPSVGSNHSGGSFGSAGTDGCYGPGHNQAGFRVVATKTSGMGVIKGIIKV